MYVLLFVSAILYALPFWFPDNIWWMVFLFPFPFLGALQKESPTFFKGYVWGFWVFAFHLEGIFISLYALASGSWYVKIAPIFCMLFFLPICTGSLFLLMNSITQGLSTPTHKVIRSAVLLAMCITYIERAILWPFDRFEGYFFMHPAVPLATHPHLLGSIKIFGTVGTLMLILAPATTALIVYVCNTAVSYILCGGTFFYWIYAAYAPASSTQSIPNWASTIARAPYVISGNHTLSNIAPQIEYAIKRILEKKPSTMCIVFPESSCHADDFYTYKKLCRAFAHPTRSLDILIGGFRWEKNRYHNTTYHVKNGILEGHIDKCHAMVLTERVPRAVSWITSFHYLYAQEEPPITPNNDERHPLLLTSHALVVPYICSELFFNHSPHDSYAHLPILFSTNDLWVKSAYLKRLMLLGAQVRAKQWNRPIIFISYTLTSYLDADGFSRPLE